eukprot:Selendium_serpulae@DN6521_c4_g1_i8.p1
MLGDSPRVVQSEGVWSARESKEQNEIICESFGQDSGSGECETDGNKHFAENLHHTGIDNLHYSGDDDLMDTDKSEDAEDDVNHEVNHDDNENDIRVEESGEECECEDDDADFRDRDLSRYLDYGAPRARSDWLATLAETFVASVFANSRLDESSRLDATKQRFDDEAKQTPSDGSTTIDKDAGKLVCNQRIDCLELERDTGACPGPGESENQIPAVTSPFI